MLHYDVQSGGVVVQEMRAELAHLAHRCSEIDKYRVESCCIMMCKVVVLLCRKCVLSSHI